MNLGTIMAKKFLTNEKLRGIFKNNFELTNEAIAYARAHIQEDQDKNLDEVMANIAKAFQDKKGNSEKE